jgi:release factor glutamine methyltransferase
VPSDGIRRLGRDPVRELRSEAEAPRSSELDVVAQLRAAGCVFAEDEARLLVAESRDGGHLAEMVRRRVAGEPLEHVLGWVEFCGRRYAVEPGVFVPRRRSQLLVSEAVRRTSRGALRSPVVVDLCCGCGALGLAVAERLPGARLFAVDIDPVAVACARRNVGLRPWSVFCGDLVAPLPDDILGAVDVIVANAPYVPSAEIDFLPADSRDHEPLTALDGGVDGLDIQRRVIAAAGALLKPGGCVVVETSEPQAPTALAVVRWSNLDAELVERTEMGATAVVGTRIDDS